MDTIIQISINSALVMVAVTIVACALTFAGNALASDAVEEEPAQH